MPGSDQVSHLHGHLPVALALSATFWGLLLAERVPVVASWSPTLPLVPEWQTALARGHGLGKVSALPPFRNTFLSAFQVHISYYSIVF